jgi:hypothetical protein
MRHDMSDTYANESSDRCGILLWEFVFDHFAALHHEPDSFEFGDVFERIARDGDQVGEFTGLDAACAILPTQQFSRVDCGRASR